MASKSKTIDSMDTWQNRFQMTKGNSESDEKKTIGNKIKYLFKDKEEAPETVALCVAEDFGFVANKDGGIEFDYRGFKEELDFIWENIRSAESDDEDETMYDQTVKIRLGSHESKKQEQDPVKNIDPPAPAFNLVRTVSKVFMFGSKSVDQEEITAKNMKEAKKKQIIKDILIDRRSSTLSWLKRRLLKKSKTKEEILPVVEGKKGAPLKGRLPNSVPVIEEEGDGDRIDLAYDFVKAVSKLTFGATKANASNATKSNLDKHPQKSNDKWNGKNKSPSRTKRKPVVARSDFAASDSKKEAFQVREKENDQDPRNVAIEFVRVFTDLTFGAANGMNVKGSNKKRAPIPNESKQNPIAKHDICDKSVKSKNIVKRLMGNILSHGGGDRSGISEYTGRHPLQNQRAYEGRSGNVKSYSQNHISRGVKSVMSERNGMNVKRRTLSQGDKSVKSEYSGRRPIQQSPQAIHEPYRMSERQMTFQNTLTTDLSVASGVKPAKNASKVAPKSPSKNANSRAASNTSLRSGTKNTVVRGEVKDSRNHNADKSLLEFAIGELPSRMDYRDDEQILPNNRRQGKGLRDKYVASSIGNIKDSDSLHSSAISSKIRNRLKRSSDDRTVETLPEPDNFFVVSNLSQGGKVVRNMVSVKSGLRR
jgi:hypothetical protein